MKLAKTISLLKLAAVLIAALFTQGCVGVVVHHMQTQAFEPADVGRIPNIYAASHMSTAEKGARNEHPTTTWLKANWGKPSTVTQVMRPVQGELWTYNFDRKWCGVMPWLLVPIPLYLPVGRENVVFYVRDGRVVKADKTTLSEYQTMAGFGPEGPTAYSHRVN